MSKLDNTFGQQTVSQQQREEKIRRVFKLVAPRYDLMSFATHWIWKRFFVNFIDFKSTDIIVDLTGGTADIARKLVSKGANVIVVDPSVESN